MASKLYDQIAYNHRIWWDADPQGSAGGWDAAKVQTAVTKGYITQAEADAIIATHGHTGAFQATDAPPAAA